MKKTLAFLLALTLTVASLTGCATKEKETENTNTEAETKETEPVLPDEVRVITLAGPTGMGMAKLMDDSANGATKNTYQFTVASAPDQVSPEVIKGNFDIAAVPINLASVLYQKTSGQVQVGAVNTLGVLYLLENGDTIQSIADLKGKTLYATGQGSTPEYVLRYILSKNNIDPDQDVTIEYLAEHAELATKMKSGEVAIGMLPEPQVTVATMGSDTRVALDLTEEWSKVSDYELIQGCIIVRKEFAEEYPDALDLFMEEYEASVNFANENVEEASVLIEKAGIVAKAAVAKAALPNCNICLITGADMTNSVKEMLQVLFEANPSSVGGALPSDDFYLE